MAKLSQQLQDAGSGKETRTQRISRKQEFESEKKTFENLKARATEKQKEFEGISSINDYEKQYNILDPNLKQFFQTPTTLRTEKAGRITETRSSIQERMDYADEKIAKAEAKRDRKVENARDRRDQRGSEWYSKERNKIEDDYDETEARWRGYKKGLSKGVGQLDQNKDVSWGDIKSYASDLGRYWQDREEARNQNKQFQRDQVFERKRLEEAGYKPQIIQKFKGGKPTSVVFSFYNPVTKDWVSGAEFDIKAPVNVSGLKKLGYSAPQQRKVEFGGKTYQFQSRVGIYKAPSGEIITPYERTGVTEAQLIKQQQDIVFKEFKAKPKQVDIPFADVKNLPLGYGGQQTISTDPSSVLISEQDYYRDIKRLDLGIGKIARGTIGKAGEGFDWVKQRVHWDFSAGGTPTSPKLQFVKFGKIDQPTLVERAYVDAFKDIDKGSQKLEDWVVGKGRIEKFNIDIEKKYQTEYQAKFESKYMEDLIYERRSFEEVSGEFETSAEAKLLQKKFAKQYGEGYKELQTGLGFWKGTVAGGLGQTGLGLSKFVLKATGDPASATLTVGAVGMGVKVLKAIPPLVSTGLSVGLGVYGGIKLLDPTSTYIEKGGGLLTLALAGATLGYGAYRHLRSPVIKTVKIKAPKISLKASEVIGKDIKILTDKGMVNKILFENQKLSQTVQAGRRTIVTQKGRELLRKMWKELGIKPSVAENYIYKGVPTAQPKIKSFGFEFEKSGYQKAFLKLKNYGWTPSQAKATLRYVAPRVTDQYLSKGILTVKGAKAFGEFEYLTKRPVLDVSKKLGIKTRGAKTIKDIYDVERKLINIERGGKVSKLILEQKTRIGFSLKGGKLYKFTDADFSQAIGMSKVSKQLKGYEYLGKDVSGLDIFKQAKYKDIYSFSATQKLFPADKIVIQASKTKLINKILDLTKKKYGYRPTGVKKTPFDITDDIIEKIKPTKYSDISKLVDKLDDIGIKGSPTAKASKYYGTGQYEQTLGGLDAQTSKLLQQQLRVAVNPAPLKMFKLKDLIKVKQFDVLAGQSIAQLTAIKTATEIKATSKLKSDLKARNDLKKLLRGDVRVKVKVAQLPALKTSPALKSQLRSILALQPIMPSLTRTPILKTPTIPKITPPARTPITLPFLEGEILKKAGRMGSKSVYDRAYLPDFTARALGLKAETITEAQARKKLKKLLTGLEIRRGVKIK